MLVEVNVGAWVGRGSSVGVVGGVRVGMGSEVWAADAGLVCEGDASAAAIGESVVENEHAFKQRREKMNTSKEIFFIRMLSAPLSKRVRYFKISDLGLIPNSNG